MAGKIIHVRLRPAAELQVRGGHPWIFANSIKEQNREGEPGDLVTIFDRQDRFLGMGLYDPASPIRVRVFHAGKPIKVDEGFWAERLEAAITRRVAMFKPHTNGYRVVHGENDGFPGLVLDRYDTALVAKLYSVVWFPHWPMLQQLILEKLAPERLVLRLSKNVEGAASKFGFKDGEVVFGPALKELVVFQENGIQFEADVLRGQKTGFFLDQRENRERVEKLAVGKAVLNAFSFSGGFSLYAARGGARSVTDVDISPHALASSKRNFRLNQQETIQNCEHKLLQANVFEYLQEPGGERFDLIIIDPPSLAKRETEREGAIKAYETLAATALLHLNQGGTLVTASCSAHVTPAEFFGAVQKAALRSGRTFLKLDETLHPADHPVTFPEAQYLKCVYLKFESGANEREKRGQERKRTQRHR
jgi:23S rRNA (cytosine1962-C5)-methyltransferase